jgi:biopolymer transport protein ExbD
MRWTSSYRASSSRSPSRNSARGASGPRGVDLQLTPMIDCVFLLLVYFLWSSSFVVAERVLPSELSSAPGTGAATAETTPPPEADFDPLVIRVLATPAGPAWRVNDAPLASLAELQKLLATIARIERAAPLVIHPNPDVPLGDVIDVLDLTRVAGFENVQLAAAGDL